MVTASELVPGPTHVETLPELRAAEPPEARGLKRDEVRLLVSSVARHTLEHACFRDLPRWLTRGDVLVVNTSGTLNAALIAARADGERFELHLSTELPPGRRKHLESVPDVADLAHPAKPVLWIIEVRRLPQRTPRAGVSKESPSASLPYREAHAGTTYRLPAGGQATLVAPLSPDSTRLWIAALYLNAAVPAYLDRYGRPIRYDYVTRAWPGAMYQTVFATEPGSAEMPSAGRPFTPELVTRLVSRGIQIAPLLLHTGVASLESHEPPYEEFFSVSPDTARRVTAARHAGHRIVAVGTTVVRALETVTDQQGTTFPGRGWTNLVVTAGHAVRSVNGLITGLHEAGATHLTMLQQIADASHIDHAYAEARRVGYLWHEFGDSHLILGRATS